MWCRLEPGRAVVESGRRRVAAGEAADAIAEGIDIRAIVGLLMPERRLGIDMTDGDDLEAGRAWSHPEMFRLNLPGIDSMNGFIGTCDVQGALFSPALVKGALGR